MSDRRLRVERVEGGVRLTFAGSESFAVVLSERSVRALVRRLAGLLSPVEPAAHELGARVEAKRPPAPRQRPEPRGRPLHRRPSRAAVAGALEAQRGPRERKS